MTSWMIPSDGHTIAAVLFDLDGTLVDSERESAEAMARVLVRDRGIQVTQEQRDFVIGHSWNEIHRKLAAEHPSLGWSMQELIAAAAAERVHVLAELGLTIMPGAVAAVTRLGTPRALVTGSSREEAQQALAVLGLGHAFPVIFASEDVREGKPSPEGYLAAARALGVEPQHCLVIEDSAAGVAAGRAAGATVIAVRAGNFGKQDQSAAHHIVDTLDEIDHALLARLRPRAP
jgi:sugar-phosphatase